ncbi:MAG TPA: T9SS type A sorting domain-containing protein [Saprospiraceae bacterium]|nr:T9SS type A sorting domain-containing protein [Saprospiraceae bacterium]
MNINKSVGSKANAWFSYITRAGMIAVLVVMLSSSAWANSFRYVQNVKMDKEQTHYYNVILSDETTVNTYLFTFDFEKLKSDDLVINLPDGSTYFAHRRPVTPTMKFGSREMWVGVSQGVEVHLVPQLEERMLTGHLLLDGKIYSVRSLTNGLQVLVEYDDTGLETCGTTAKVDEPVLEKDVPFVPTNPDAKESSTNKAVVVLNDECYIRVLVGYTLEAAANEADEVGLAMTAISLANTGYSNSGVDQEIQLVRVYFTGYSDAGKAQGTVLNEWRATGDGIMDDVHTERTLHRADMCALITNIGSGIASTTVTAANAFSLTNRTFISGFTFHHELGHNHSCQHDPTAYGGASNYRGYGHPLGYFRTVMAYGSACGAGSCTRVNEFSGPSNFYFYAPTSTNYVTGDATHNNVAGHNNNNGTVVAHRQIQVALSYSGAYNFGNHEYANFAGENTATYSSGTNQMIYSSGSEGSISAGNSVTLGEGFWAKSGTTFEAYLEPTCTSISLNGGSTTTLQSGNDDASNMVSTKEESKNTDLGIEDIKVFPNPFSETATIRYTLNEEGSIAIRIFDFNGKLVTTLVDDTNHSKGQHSVTFDGSKLPAGMYHCRMTTKNNVKVIALSLSR